MYGQVEVSRKNYTLRNLKNKRLLDHIDLTEFITDTLLKDDVYFSKIKF